MRILKTALLIIGFGALPLLGADQPVNLDQLVDHIVSRENAVVASLRQFTPLVETYVQIMHQDKELGTVPSSDRYFLGKADLSKGVRLGLLTPQGRSKLNVFGKIKDSLVLPYEPNGFLQMIFVDSNSFDRLHYKFEYVGREFLGEVRCMVLDATPLPNTGKGRFVGRIWVEDQDYTIVRFNGVYAGKGHSSSYFHFDSWRVNTGPGLWLPAYVYSEESDFHYGLHQHVQFKAQTRLWGYNLPRDGVEQELTQVFVEAAIPVRDLTTTANDLSPIQAQRAWDRQAEDNLIDRLERIGLLAPRGEVDTVLQAVVNNLEVTNNLDIQREVRCRILLTSTLESFTVGHTIVLSRGLIDVLPDEASLATMVAHELAYIELGYRLDPQYGFYDRLRFADQEIYEFLEFTRPAKQEEKAKQRATELLVRSPYKDQMRNAALFVAALHGRAGQIPNLVSPHLGNRVPVSFDLGSSSTQRNASRANHIIAQPLGGRVKIDPWSDSLEMIKVKPEAVVSERDNMPFEITAFMPYLTRLSDERAPAAVTAASGPGEKR